MPSKFKLVEEYNEKAHEEVRLAGSPTYECPNCGPSRFGCKHATYDTDEIWGVHPLDLKDFVKKVHKRYVWCLLPWRRRNLKRYYWLWECREAAAHGLSISWSY